jgi:predicted DNA-binding transcriptional regulator AlpA
MGETTEMLLRMPEVCRLTGRTRDQVYRDIRAGSGRWINASSSLTA